MAFQTPIEKVEEVLGPRYTLLDVAGRGQASVVYKVADRLAGNEIKAAKVYELPVGDRETRRNEISHEFLLGSRFHHPNLVRYMDLHLDHNSAHALVTMEYLGGAVLNLGRKRLQPETAGLVFLQLLRALGALHEAGYIHGDVKPSNVWCRIDGESPRLKLLDYHLTYRKTEITGHTSRGTLRYLSPEAISGDKVDERSDLYSAGVFFYELLKGRPLYSGTPRELARMHVTAAVPRLDLEDPRSAALDGFLAKLLAKKSVSRYSGAAEAAGDLVRILSLPVSAESVETLVARIHSVPVVAREDDLAQIRKFLDSDARSLTVLLVHGTAGLGKSRLIQECLRLAQSQGMPSVRFENLRSAEAVAAQLESALGGQPVPRRRSLSRAAVGGSISPAFGSEGLSPAMLARLNDLSEWIAFNSLSEKALIACDDTHRAAPDAVQALLFLMRALHDRAVRWCLASAPGAMSQVLGQEIAKAGEPGVINLSELGVSEKKALLAAALPKKTAPSIIDDIAGRCGGAPSALLRRTEHLVRCGALKCGEDGLLVLDSDVSEKDADILGAGAVDWLRNVPEKVRSAAEVLAVAGGEVRLAELAAAVGAEPAELHRMMLGDAVAPHISCREARDAVLVRFQYYESYGSIRTMLSRERTSLLHDKLAGALGRSAYASRWEIARHRLLGRMPRQAVKRVTRLISQEVYGSPMELVAVLDLALPLSEPEERSTLLEARADVGIAVGDVEFAEKIYRDLLGRQIDLERKLRVMRKLAALLTMKQEIEESLKLLSTAMKYPGIENHPREVANIHLAAVETKTRSADPDRHEVEMHCAVAEKIGEELHDDSLIGRALTIKGRWKFHSNDLRGASQCLIRAIVRLRRSSDTVAVGKALVSLGYVAILRNKFTRAFDILERASDAFRVAGRLEDAAQAFLTMGSNYQRQCDWDKALERYDEALRLFHLAGRANGQAAALGNKAHVCSESGKLEQAIQYANMALNYCRSNIRLKCSVTHRLAYAQYLMGSVEEASANVCKLIDEAEKSSLTTPLEAGHRLAGAIAVSRGDWPGALYHTEAALKIIGDGNRGQESECLARLGEICLHDGQNKEALARTEESVQAAIDAGSEHALALALMARGQVEAQSGNVEKALETLKEAERLSIKRWIWKDILTVSIELCKIYRSRGELRFASYYLRSAADVVDHVVAHMESEESKFIFLNDPRRLALMQEARALREVAERGVSDAEGA